MNLKELDIVSLKNKHNKLNNVAFRVCLYLFLFVVFLLRYPVEDFGLSEIFLFAILICALFIFVCQYTKQQIYIAIEKNRRMNTINPEKLALSCILYGLREGPWIAIECNEIHLSGDCLLCGAK